MRNSSFAAGDTLAAKLSELQGRDGLNNSDFAARIGMHEKGWIRKKHGRGGESWDQASLSKIVRAYPVEMGPAICRELLGDDCEARVREMFSSILAEFKGGQEG